MSKLLNTIKGIIPMGARDLDEALEMGMDWSLREGYVWAEDKVEQYCCMRTCVDINYFIYFSPGRSTARSTAGC